MESGAYIDQALTISLVGIVIVFVALVFLFLVFSNLSKVLNKETRKRLVKEGKLDQATEDELMIPGDVAAAIGMALYLNDEVHDEESGIITIKREPKSYSPWSSKIYGLRKSPR
ncbi:MAG: OadG family protein [Hyphomicrobiales bacterium]